MRSCKSGKIYNAMISTYFPSNQPTHIHTHTVTGEKYDRIKPGFSECINEC